MPVIIRARLENNRVRAPTKLPFAGVKRRRDRGRLAAAAAAAFRSFTGQTFPFLF